MSSCNVIMSCHHIMSSCAVIMSCHQFISSRAVIMSCHVIPCHHVMPSCHVIMISCHVSQPTSKTSCIPTRNLISTPGSILTSRTETSSLSRVVRDSWDPCSVPLSEGKVSCGGVFDLAVEQPQLFRKLPQNPPKLCNIIFIVRETSIYFHLLMLTYFSHCFYMKVLERISFLLLVSLARA